MYIFISCFFQGAPVWWPVSYFLVKAERWMNQEWTCIGPCYNQTTITSLSWDLVSPTVSDYYYLSILHMTKLYYLSFIGPISHVKPNVPNICRLFDLFLGEKFCRCQCLVVIKVSFPYNSWMLKFTVLFFRSHQPCEVCEPGKNCSSFLTFHLAVKW